MLTRDEFQAIYLQGLAVTLTLFEDQYASIAALQDQVKALQIENQSLKRHADNASPQHRLRVVIAEDHINIAQVIKARIDREPDMEVIGVAYQAQSAIGLVLRKKPDVVLMDLGMPNVEDGIEAIRQIRRDDPNIKIAVLTGITGDNALFSALKAGAIGYVTKDTAPEAIAEAVRAVAKGEVSIPPHLVQTMCDAFERVKMQPAQLIYLFSTLTDSEAETLMFLTALSTNKEIAKNSEIAKSRVVSEQRVKDNMRSIFKKLHINNRLEALLMAQSAGLTKESTANPKSSKWSRR